jgi:hypothetical protein
MRPMVLKKVHALFSTVAGGVALLRRGKRSFFDPPLNTWKGAAGGDRMERSLVKATSSVVESWREEGVSVKPSSHTLNWSSLRGSFIGEEEGEVVVVVRKEWGARLGA